MKEVSKGKLYSVILGCFMLMLSSGVVSNSNGYFLTAVRDYLGCSTAQFSLYYSFVQMCTVLTSLCIGIIMNKVPRRVFLTVGAIGTACGFMFLSQTRALWMLYAGAACVGLFQALIVVPNVQILNSWMPKGSGIAMGFVMSATGFAGIIMAQIMPRIVANVSWRTGYIVCACLFLCLSLVGMILAGGNPPYEQAAKAKARFSTVAKDPMFWLFIICCFLGNGASNIDQHLTPMMQIKGFTVGMISGAMTLFNISLLIFKISQGAIYQKLSGKRFVLIYSVIAVFGYLCLQLSGNLFYFAIIMKAFAGAGITVIYSLVCNEYFGVKFGGAVWGFSWASFQFGATFFSPLYGSFVDRYGDYNRSTYIGAVICLFIGAVYYFMLTHKKAEAGIEETPSTEN